MNLRENIDRLQNEIKVNDPISAKEVFNYFIKIKNLFVFDSLYQDYDNYEDANFDYDFEDWKEFDDKIFRAIYSIKWEKYIDSTWISIHDLGKPINLNLNKFKKLIGDGDEEENILIIAHNF